MLIIGATLEELEYALAQATKRYEHNIRFKVCRHLKDRDGRPAFRVRLGYKNRWGRGVQEGPSWRATGSACWHVYGYFIGALPPEAEIHTTAGSESIVIKPGHPWRDWRVSDYVGREYASECCHCKRHEEAARNNYV